MTILTPVFVLPAFLAAAACDRIRAAMDRGDQSPAEVWSNGYLTKEDARRAFDVEVDARTVADVQRALADASPRIADFFGMPLIGQEGPGFLRYPCGGYYRIHRDTVPEWNGEFPRRISVVLFLSSAEEGGGAACEGGSLRLYALPDRHEKSLPLDIPPVCGTLVAFPSIIPHEVLPVTAGVRDAVVDWFY